VSIFGKYLGRYPINSAIIKFSGKIPAEKDLDVGEVTYLIVKVEGESHKYKKESKLGWVKEIFTTAKSAAAVPEGLITEIASYMDDVEQRTEAEKAEAKARAREAKGLPSPLDGENDQDT